jgi:large subunit ribosomal protein L1
VSMEADKLKENVKTLLETIERKRPSDIKGEFIRSVALSSTMGPGIKISAKDMD